MKQATHGRAHARFRGVLALLVAVVALLCVFGHAERGGPGAPPSTAERVHAPAVAEPSDGAAAPCGKKAIADPSVQRAENPPPSAACPGPASLHTDPAPSASQRSGTLSGSPAPPPVTLHSVLRI